MCVIGGAPKYSCCGGLACKRKGRGGPIGGMGVCEEPKDGDEDEDKQDEPKARAKVYS